MVAWDRRELSVSEEDLYSDSSPGLWESLSVDPDAPEAFGAPMAQAVDCLQEMVGNGLSAILSGDWHQLMGLVEEAPEHAIGGGDVLMGPDVVPI